MSKTLDIKLSWIEFENKDSYPSTEEVLQREQMYEETSKSLEYSNILKESLEQDLLDAIGTAGLSAVIEIFHKYDIKLP